MSRYARKSMKGTMNKYWAAMNAWQVRPDERGHIRQGTDATLELSAEIKSTNLFIERSGGRGSPQLLI
jgi:hypothetical protein